MFFLFLILNIAMQFILQYNNLYSHIARSIKNFYKTDNIVDKKSMTKTKTFITWAVTQHLFGVVGGGYT